MPCVAVARLIGVAGVRVSTASACRLARPRLSFCTWPEGSRCGCKMYRCCGRRPIAADARRVSPAAEPPAQGRCAGHRGGGGSPCSWRHQVLARAREHVQGRERRDVGR